MIRAVSVPIVSQTPLDTSLETWPTLWRTYADTKDMIYFFESALEPKFLWTNFADHDFVNGGVQRLEIGKAGWQQRVGDMNGEFTAASVFQPVGAGK